MGRNERYTASTITRLAEKIYNIHANEKDLWFLLICPLLDNITFYGFIGQTEQMVQP